MRVDADNVTLQQTFLAQRFESKNCPFEGARKERDEARSIGAQVRNPGHAGIQLLRAGSMLSTILQHRAQTVVSECSECLRVWSELAPDVKGRLTELTKLNSAPVELQTRIASLSMETVEHELMHLVLVLRQVLDKAPGLGPGPCP